ncbi:MAG: hypothetical protein ACFCUO_05925 [Rhodospirillales bacterium]
MRLRVGHGAARRLSVAAGAVLLSLIVVGCDTVTRPATGSEEPLQTGVHIPAECVDTAMIGAASGVYGDTNACLGDQPALRDRARDAGQRNCAELCQAMSCKPTKLAFPSSPQAICTGRNFNTALSYGVATTGRFVCRCVIPDALMSGSEG